jgi:hypothetical protein
MSAAEKFVATCRREREQFPLEPVSVVAQDSRAELIGWALDVLRRYAPEPLVDARELDEELDAIEHMDAEQFFNDEQCPSDGQFR